MRDVSVSLSIWCSAIDSRDFWAFSCDDKKPFQHYLFVKTSHHDKVTIQWSKKEEDKTG